MALRTDSTRVITCGIGSEGNASGIPEIGILQTRHGLSHHNGDPEQLRRLTLCDTFLVEQFSYFLDELKSHQEGDNTLLDTTQVLWGSGMAYVTAMATQICRRSWPAAKRWATSTESMSTSICPRSDSTTWPTRWVITAFAHGPSIATHGLATCCSPCCSAWM